MFILEIVLIRTYMVLIRFLKRFMILDLAHTMQFFLRRMGKNYVRLIKILLKLSLYQIMIHSRKTVLL